MKILISRTDAIGDVILTLPLAGLLKKEHPQAEIYFLGSDYTREIVGCAKSVSRFLNWSDLKSKSDTEIAKYIEALNIDHVIHVFPVHRIAKICRMAGIKNRIGTRSRWYHWLYCNVKPGLHRRKSDKHESLLNIELARKGGLLSGDLPESRELMNYYMTEVPKFWPKEIFALKDDASKKVILHVGSRMSARNWPLEHFVELARMLTVQGAKVFLTGTQKEGDVFRDDFKNLGPNVVDLTGKLNLKELFGFIASVDALVACSTGPLHMAAAAGIRAVGIYPPQRPMHAGRWGPLGRNVKALFKEGIGDCRRCVSDTAHCQCMRDISPLQVVREIKS